MIMVLVGALIVPEAEMIVPNLSLSMRVPSNVYGSVT